MSTPDQWYDLIWGAEESAWLGPKEQIGGVGSRQGD